MEPERDLESKLQGFVKTYQDRHGHNFKWDRFLIFLGIALSTSVGIAGILGCPTLAAILGLLSTAVFAIYAAYAVGERSEFQRIIAMEAENLLLELQFQAKTEEDRRKVLAAFMALRRQADTALPRGSGMDAVRRMYEEITAARKGA